MVTNIVENAISPVRTPKLESETKSDLWKTSTTSIKYMGEVNYVLKLNKSPENINDEIIHKDGKIVYIET